MQHYEPRGIETSPPREASPANGPTICPDEERCAEIGLALFDLRERMEFTSWNDVLGITAVKATAWNGRLVEAHDGAQATGQPERGA